MMSSSHGSARAPRISLGGIVMRWAFVLDDAEHDSTPLGACTRKTASPHFLISVVGDELPCERDSFRDERQQLIEIARRADHPGNVETRGPEERQDAA